MRPEGRWPWRSGVISGSLRRSNVCPRGKGTVAACWENVRLQGSTWMPEEAWMFKRSEASLKDRRRSERRGREFEGEHG